MDKASLHPDFDVRMEATGVMMKILERRTDHSDILPESVESPTRCAQEAGEIRIDGLKLGISMLSKPGEIAKVVSSQTHPSRIILAGWIGWHPV